MKKTFLFIFVVFLTTTLPAQPREDDIIIHMTFKGNSFKNMKGWCKNRNTGSWSGHENKIVEGVEIIDDIYSLKIENFECNGKQYILLYKGFDGYILDKNEYVSQIEKLKDDSYEIGLMQFSILATIGNVSSNGHDLNLLKYKMKNEVLRDKENNPYTDTSEKDKNYETKTLFIRYKIEPDDVLRFIFFEEICLDEKRKKADSNKWINNFYMENGMRVTESDLKRQADELEKLYTVCRFDGFSRILTYEPEIQQALASNQIFNLLYYETSEWEFKDFFLSTIENL